MPLTLKELSDAAGISPSHLGRIERGERFPLTIADADPEEGTVTIVFQAVGKSTRQLAGFEEKDAILDLVGPLGHPTHVEKFGHVVCIGGGVGIALGAAFSAKYRDTDQVTVCFFSEGAANQGVLHECLNMAALWRLPVIYLCENNRYAATTPVSKSTCTEDIAPRAAAYGLPWAIADGNDCLDVCRAVGSAVVRARAGEGATFVECKTYRVEPHCGIIPDGRDREEILLWRSLEKDPILRSEAQFLADKTLTAQDIQELHAEVETELDEAVEFARNSPFPDPETVADGFWAH